MNASIRPALVAVNGQRVDLRTEGQKLEDWQRWAALPSTPTRDHFLDQLAEACAGFTRQGAA